MSVNVDALVGRHGGKADRKAETMRRLERFK